MSGEIWRVIPHYSGYEASSLGRIRNRKNREVLKQRESRTTKGTYKCVTIWPDKGKRRSQLVHRLICMAFYGVPGEYPKIDTNHKDGDKHNNVPSNLEWSTRSDNVKHAYAEGLNDHCTKGRIVDLLTKQEHDFATAEDVGRFFDIPNHEGRDIIRYFQEKPYKDRYLIVIDRYKVPDFKRNKRVYLVDFVNNKFIHAKTITQLSYITGLNNTSIAMRLRGETDLLLNGCYIGDPTDPLVFEKLKNYTPEDVRISVERYKKDGGVRDTVQTKGWLVKNYVTGEILRFRTLKDIASGTGLNHSHIRTYTQKGKTYLVKGYVIKKEHDETPFPEYSDLLVQISLKHQVANGQPIAVTDLTSNTTEYYGNLSIFAKQLGEDVELFRQKWKNGSITQYKIEYVK